LSQFGQATFTSVQTFLQGSISSFLFDPAPTEMNWRSLFGAWFVQDVIRSARDSPFPSDSARNPPQVGTKRMAALPTTSSQTMSSTPTRTSAIPSFKTTTPHSFLSHASR